MILNNENADEIRDAIISSLYAKTAERIESLKPYVAANMFNDEIEDENYDDYDNEDGED